jgi:hypothetical protein
MGRLYRGGQARAGDFELLGEWWTVLFGKAGGRALRAGRGHRLLLSGEPVKLLAFGVATGCPLLLGTTGYTPEQLAAIREAARKPRRHSSNLLDEAFVLDRALKRIAPKLM